jgi:hypothetical protein
MLVEKEIKKANHIHNSYKQYNTIQYTQINLTKEVKDLCNENSKTIMKEIGKMEGYLMFMNWKNQYC